MKTRYAESKTSLVAVGAIALLLAGCGGGGGDTPQASTCPSFAGSYTVTTEIVGTTCALGLHVITQPITWTFTQTVPSCDFTMSNSLYPSSVYQGHFTMAGSQAKVTWDAVTPAPISGGFALTYTAEDLTVAPAAAGAAAFLFGSFGWHSAANCNGSTNVCHGAVPAGCVTPQ